jgi:transposase InsO family protein
MPDHIRSDNGPEFTATMVRGWLSRLEVQTLFITPGSPWENGYEESFNCRLKQFLKGKIFDTLQEAQILVEQWRVHYNTVRPHSPWAIGPGTRNPSASVSATLRRKQKCDITTGTMNGGRSCEERILRFKNYFGISSNVPQILTGQGLEE